MTDLSGTNPNFISVGVWAVSTLFAGLAGVLAAPIVGLDPDKFTILIAASFAAVVAARLRNLTVAVVVALLMGIATSLIEGYLPPSSAWTTEFIDAVPFIVVAVVLIYELLRRGRVGETDGWGGALDRAITPQGESRLAGSTSSVVESASARILRQVRRAGAAHRRRRCRAAHRAGLLGRRHGGRLRLRRHPPVLDHRHR